MQLDLLWGFMQVDMEADRFESDMRQAENRQKLLKNRNFIIEQQANMKKIEDEVAAMADRMEAVADEEKRLDGVIAAQKKALEEIVPSELEEIEKQISAVQKLLDSLTHYEQELTKMRKDAETRDNQQREIRVRAAKAKAEYDRVKQVYDVEFKNDTEKLKKLRAKAEQEGKKIDPALLERYHSIKQHATPPMAMIMGDQCGRCNMSLPSVALRNLKAGEAIVTCDNCGRIVYVQEGQG